MLPRERTDVPFIAADRVVVDRRLSNRYPLQMPVTFAWRDVHANPHQDQGNTRDISSIGEFVLARNCPDEGAPITLDILLPRAPTAVRALWIQVEGIVVRVDQRENGKSMNGFAVANLKSVLSDRP